MILIYFADHGESPATARGHDSSRLTYESFMCLFLFILMMQHMIYIARSSKN